LHVTVIIFAGLAQDLVYHDVHLYFGFRHPLSDRAWPGDVRL